MMGLRSAGQGSPPTDVAFKFPEERCDSSGGDAMPASDWQHPPSFYCPISQQVMHDPVVLCDGHTYERRHIERWLQDHTRSPVSNEVLSQQTMFPNHALRNAIEEYFAQVFSVHRQAIRKTIKDPTGEQQNIGSNESLHCTIDALMQCSFLMNADLSVERILRQIMNEARNLLGAEAASVFLVDSEKQELFSTVNSTDGELRIPISKGIAGHVASSGEPLIIDNAYSDDRFNRANDIKTGFRTENMMCVPLKQKKGNVIGVVQLINKSGSGVFNRSQARSADSSRPSFTQQDLQFLQVFASQAATAVANSGEISSETQTPPQKQNTIDYDDHNDDFLKKPQHGSGWKEQSDTQSLAKPKNACGLREQLNSKVSAPYLEVDVAKRSPYLDLPLITEDDTPRTTGRKKSGRARQRTAKWWASVRRKTPSPEPMPSPLHRFSNAWCATQSI